MWNVRQHPVVRLFESLSLFLGLFYVMCYYFEMKKMYQKLLSMQKGWRIFKINKFCWQKNAINHLLVARNWCDKKVAEYFAIIKYAGKINGSFENVFVFFQVCDFLTATVANRAHITLSVYINEFGKWILLSLLLLLLLPMQNGRN